MNLADAASRSRLAALLFRSLLLSLALPAFASANAGGEAPACRDEPALSRAAAELLLTRSWGRSEAVARAVQEAGSDAVLVRGYYFHAADPGPDAFLSEFARGADAPTVCGFAQGAEDRLLLVAARGGSLKEVSERTRKLRGELSPGFDHPELVVADVRGQLKRWAVEPQALTRGVALPEELGPPVRVQLLARGPQGVRPVAERTVPSNRGVTGKSDLGPTSAVMEGAPPPASAVPPVVSAAAATGEPPSRRPVVEPGATGVPRPAAQVPDAPAAVDASTLLSQRLMSLRGSNARRALRSNALLDRVAREQAEAVCSSGRVGHEPEPGRDPQTRLLQAGVQARRVGETVARAEDASAAFAAFERSPAHRLSLLEPGFTDAGYGDAVDAHGRHCVVILLAAWPRFVGK